MIFDPTPPRAALLLLPVENEAQPRSESTARAERLLQDVDVLFGAAGIHLDEVVLTDGAGPELGEHVRFGEFDAPPICAEEHPQLVGVPRLAAGLAHAHGIEVIHGGGVPGPPGWSRGLVGPPFHWHGPRERAT